MDLPSRRQRQRFRTDRTTPILLQPKVTCRPTPRQGAGQVRHQALLKVQLPGRVVRVRSPSDFYVSAKRRGLGLHEEDRTKVAFPISDRATEPPPAVSRLREVFALHPGRRLLPVPP